MLQLTTGLIENAFTSTIDMTPTCIIPIKLFSIPNRPCATLGVKISNGDTVTVGIEIKGFYMKGTTKIEYVSDLLYVDAGNMFSRQYYVQYDAFEFQFISSSQAVEVSAWGINSVGQSTSSYSVKPVEVDDIVVSVGAVSSTGGIGSTEPTGADSLARAQEAMSAQEVTRVMGAEGEPEAEREPESVGESEAQEELENEREPEAEGEPEIKREPGSEGEPEIQGEPEAEGVFEAQGESEVEGELEAKGESGVKGELGAQGVVGATGPTGIRVPRIALRSPQMVYVSQGGNDISGDGTIINPYATIPKAMASIVDASPTKRYSMILGPGNYNESFSLKANVIVIGVDPILVRIGTERSSIDIDDPTWSVSGDNRSGFKKVTLAASTLAVDFKAQSSFKNMVYFDNVQRDNI